MKKCFYPLVTIALVSASLLFTGCKSRAQRVEAALKEIKDIQEGGQLYKEHTKQADKYVFPNASLAISQALYLPIGGALSDMVNETVGNEYLRSYLLVETNGVSYVKIWGNIRDKYNDGWMNLKTAERMAYLANWESMKKRLNNSTAKDPLTKEEYDATVSSFDEMEKGFYELYEAESFLIANLGMSRQNEKGEFLGFMQTPADIQEVRIKMSTQIKDIDSIPDDLLKFEVINELVKVKRTQEACVFMDQDEADRVAFYNKKAKNGEGEAYVNWLGLNEARNDSKAYQEYQTRKEEIEARMNEAKAKAWANALEEDGKVTAFTSYWIADIGKVAYPIVSQLIPGKVGGILSATSPVAVLALDTTEKALASKYEWLPNSLTIEFDEYPALKTQFGANASLTRILSNIGVLLDQDKIATLARVANINFTDWVAIILGAPDLLMAADYTYSLVKQVKNDLSDEEYGKVPLDIIGTLGSTAGLDFISALDSELDHYRYANEVALKRMEYTVKAMEWLSCDTMETLFYNLYDE